MDWSALGKKIAGFAPLLGGAIMGPGGAALGALVANAVGADDPQDPASIAVAIDRNPDAAIRLQEVQNAHKERLEELALQRYQAELNAETAQQQQVNETMRAEYTAKSGYRAGWRPLYGYVSAIGFGGILAALIYALFTNPGKASDLINSATVVLTLMLAVLGVNIKQRSNDKAIAVGQRPLGIVEALAGLTSRK